MRIDREELAWAAGFLDGEGCFTGAYRTVTKDTRTFYPLLTVSQVHRPSLRRLQRVFHAGSIIKRPAQQVGWSDQWLYQVNGFEKVQAITAMVWIWLGRVKREQAARCLQLHLSTVNR